MKRMILAALMVAGLFCGTSSFAVCLQNCTSESTSRQNAPNFNSIGTGANRVQYRERSHNTRDVKNSVMGDVNIRVGHDKLDIKMDSNSSSNTVDASVTSTIILGDMKK